MNKKIKLFSLVLATISFASCNKEDATGYSTLQVNDTVGTIAAVTPTLVFGNTPIVVNEKDENVYTFTVTLDKPQPVAIKIKTVQIAGDATMDEDYEVSVVTIPAYATSAVGTIKILNDDTVESIETATLQISDVTTSNASVVSQAVTFSINNYVSTSLQMSLKFDHAFSISGTDYTLCGYGYDMDFYVLDSSMNDTGNNTAATGACVEKLKMDLADYPNGTYYVVFDIYDDGGISGQYHDPFDLPITVDYLRSGAITAGTFSQEDTFWANSTDGSGSDYVCTVEVLDGVFTVKNSLDDVIASGRSASFKSKIKAAISAARANNHK